MKYKHVVFDMDGTLIDTGEAIQRSLRDTIAALTGNTPSEAEVRATFGTPSDAGLKMLGVRDEDIRRGILLWGENIKKYEDTQRVFPGVRELMDGLKAEGCRLGIATSKNTAELEYSRRRFDDIVSGVDCIICADDTTEHKPKPGPLLKYMEQTGARPWEVLYVGDTVYDLRCARGAGAAFALARWGNPDGSMDADYDEPTPLALLKKLI